MDREAELICVEDSLMVLTKLTGHPGYDFRFYDWFRTKRSLTTGTDPSRVVARIGAPVNYADFYNFQERSGLMLINNPDEHALASELPRWHPALEGLTPRSMWFDHLPSAAEIEAHFSWPVFIKGARQTSRHLRKLCIAQNAVDFQTVTEAWASDPILRWQKFVCREFVPLRPIEPADPDSDQIFRSFEFRTFWWRGQLVGAGRYWTDGPSYNWTPAEREDGLAVATAAAGLLRVPFLTIDIAQDDRGKWLVIECNDAQESGYAGINPISLWQSIIDFERQAG